MQVIINIPDEFAADWNKDRFDDALHRLSADAHLIAGNYEQETAKMLADAFKNAAQPDPDTVSRQAVYDTLTEYYHHDTDIQHKALAEALSRVPPSPTPNAPKTLDANSQHAQGVYER